MPIAKGTTRPSDVAPPPHAVTVAELREKADLHMRVAELLWDAEKQRQVDIPDSLAAVAPLLAVDRQRDRAALILVQQADYLLRQERRQQAAREYQSAADLFAGTHWAAVAKQRLLAIKDGKAG